MQYMYLHRAPGYPGISNAVDRYTPKVDVVLNVPDFPSLTLPRPLHLSYPTRCISMPILITVPTAGEP